jgi:hypothetical protein
MKVKTRKFCNYFILPISLFSIIVALFFTIKSYINKTINIQYISVNIVGIMFFTGLILFYYFYKNRKLLYTSYLFLLICFFATLVYLPVAFRLKKMTPVIYAICSTYVFYSINKYLYRAPLETKFLKHISRLFYKPV